MAKATGRVADKGYTNWIKETLILLHFKEGLERFTDKQINVIHHNIKSEIQKSSSPQQSVCVSCDWENIQKGTDKRWRVKCMSKVCDQWLKQALGVHDKLHDCHIPRQDIDPKKWPICPWEVAKIYISPGCAAVVAAKDADVKAILDLFTNCVHFYPFFGQTTGLTKIKEIRNKLMHSGNQIVDDGNLQQDVQAILDVLISVKGLAQDEREPVSEAVRKIKELRDCTLDVCMNRELELRALNYKMRTLEQRVSYLESKNTFLEEGTKNLSDDYHITKTELDKVKMDISQIQAQDPRYPLNRAIYINELRKRLICLYQKRFLALPICPLVLEEKHSVEEVYTQPTIQLIDPAGMSLTKRTATRFITTYKPIFYRDSNHSKPCTDIYVTSEAGFGKSTFCLQMLACWCKAHSEEMEDTSDDIRVMSDFSLLFYLPLRHLRAYGSVDKMIEATVGEDVSEILKHGRYLILLDGLDEWVPPETNYQPIMTTHGIPSRCQTNNELVILTTSRPWKLEQLRLDTFEVDQQFDILGLDDRSARSLISKILNILNKRSGLEKTADQFSEELKKRHLGFLSSIPIILMQLVCLWFDEKDLGCSQCHVYSSMIEMLMQRELAKKEKAQYENKVHSSEVCKKLPKCFEGKTYCLKYGSLLHRLSALAYHTLLSDDQTSSLVFLETDEIFQKYDLSKEDVHFCLNVGILSQSKVAGQITARTKSLSFFHKSYQEFLAALYISNTSENIENIVSTITHVCKTLNKFMEISKLFVFVCGMRSEASSALLKAFTEAASRDQRVLEYQNTMSFTYLELLKSVQKTFIEVVEEAVNNNQTTESFMLLDVFLYETTDYRHITSLVANSQTEMRSFDVFILNFSPLLTETINKVFACLSGAKQLNKLKLVSKKFDVNFQYVQTILGNSLATLTTLVLQGFDFQEQVHICDTICNELTSLVSLGLSVKLAHQQIQQILSFSSRHTHFKELGLWLQCKDHGSDCELQIDLSDLTELKHIGLGEITISGLNVHCEKLEHFFIRNSTIRTSIVNNLIIRLLNRNNVVKVEIENSKIINDTAVELSDILCKRNDNNIEVTENECDESGNVRAMVCYINQNQQVDTDIVPKYVRLP